MERNVFTENQEAWLNALESGEFRQTREALVENPNGVCSYCCLGVAVKVIDPDHPVLEVGEWSADDEAYKDYDEGIDGATAPPDIVEALNLSNSAGGFRQGYTEFVNRLGESIDIIDLTQLNDNMQMTFPEIAAYIRKNPWQVFKNFDIPEERDEQE